MAAEVLVVDNYDSFTHNLVDLLAQLGAEVRVQRNDEVDLDLLERDPPRGVVLSPGPGRPEEAGVCVDLVRRFGASVPIFGVCLGHQALAVAYGGRVVHARRPLHGTATPVRHAGRGVLAGLPQGFEAARYHSLVVDPRRLGRGLEASAWSPEGEVMALVHRRDPVEGVQFHPESHLTPQGPRMLAAFLRRTGLKPRPVRGVVR
jgi:anthranilate synthase/aminodeoxychorismate synthase-like glutamine amidotransferase